MQFLKRCSQLQTRRLLAGDTLNLDTDKSFYIVVDGCVQVFAQTGNQSKARDAYDDEDDNGYQLLNNVESGGTLSSLFTILSLFTEDVKLRYEEDGIQELARNSTFSPPSQAESNAHPNRHRKTNSRTGDRNADVTEFNLDESLRRRPPPTTAPRPIPNRNSVSPSPSTGRPLSQASSHSSSTAYHSGDSATEHGSPPFASTSRPLDPIQSAPGTPGFGGLGSERRGSETYSGTRSGTERSREHSFSPEAKEGTIARATVDTTLAVIPAEAFRRLTKKFPNAAA